MAISKIPIDIADDLILSKIESKKQFEEILHIYLESFPESERRPLHNLERALEDRRAEFWIISHRDCPIGFLNTWQLSGCVFSEHFAIAPKLRGKKIGERVLRAYMERTPRPFILEVEPPTSPTRQRRLNFYKRLGLEVIDVNYHQPPYRPDQPKVPLHLMATSSSMQGDRAERVVREIKEVVYGLPIEESTECHKDRKKQ